MAAPWTASMLVRRPDLADSKEVRQVAAYLRSNGRLRANAGPSPRVEAYIGLLSEVVHHGALSADPAARERLINARVVRRLPEDYYEFRRDLAAEQGQPFTLNDSARAAIFATVQEDQRGSLGRWLEALDRPAYPMWFRFEMWEAVSHLGPYNRQRAALGRRSTGTASLFPEINEGAIERTLERLQDSRSDTWPIAHVYAKELVAGSVLAPELAEQRRGAWYRVGQTSDTGDADHLAAALEPWMTGWCTRGAASAAEQLAGGDLYLYATRDAAGQARVPRLAIRMQGQRVAEVRGVADFQEVEDSLLNVLEARLVMLPGAQAALATVADRRRLASVVQRVSEGHTVPAADARFVHGPVRGFGYHPDARLVSLQRRLPVPGPAVSDRTLA